MNCWGQTQLSMKTQLIWKPWWSVYLFSCHSQGDTKWLKLCSPTRLSHLLIPLWKTVIWVVCSHECSLQPSLKSKASSYVDFPLFLSARDYLNNAQKCVFLSLHAEVSLKSRRAMQKKIRWKKKRRYLEKHFWYVSLFEHLLCQRRKDDLCHV